MNPFREEYRRKTQEQIYTLYVEYKMSMKEVAKEMLISKPTVKYHLDRLEVDDPEKYDIYRNEVKRRKKFNVY